MPHSLYWHEPVIKCDCMLKLCPESGTIVVLLYFDKKGTKGEQLCLTCAIALKGSGTQVGYDNCISFLVITCLLLLLLVYSGYDVLLVDLIFDICLLLGLKRKHHRCGCIALILGMPNLLCSY